MTKKKNNLSLISDKFEMFAQTEEGLPLWKMKNVEISYENLLDNIFVLSVDLASYFEIRHNNLVNQNISKLQKEKYLSDHLLKIKQMVKIGSAAERSQIVYMLTRHQTEHLIMDFSGPKARQKKHKILNRLHAIEKDVLQGSYIEARGKAQNFDGVQLLKDMGFSCSVEDRLATKKDIALFLNVPETTVSSFFRKQRDQIKPVKLDIRTIRDLGSSANQMNAYILDDVLKVAFWMQSEISSVLKQHLLGKKSSVLLKEETRKEMEWRSIMAKIFEGFDLRYNHKIGSYRVDFFIARLSLCLELDEDHDSYDLAEEEERERYISRHYTIIRFNNDTSLEELFNAILKVEMKEVIRLYG